MKKLVLFIFLNVFCGAAMAQSDASNYEIVTHEVKQGETIRMLSLKYFATPSDIYKMNKFAVNGISPGMSLQIPVKRKVSKPVEEVSQAPEVHSASEVQHSSEVHHAPEVHKSSDVHKSTSIAEEPSGPAAAEQKSTMTSSSVESHTVLPGETLSALARKYNTTVTELKLLNEKALKRGLQSGQVLKLPYSGTVASTAVATSTEPTKDILKDEVKEVSATEVAESNNSGPADALIEHKVASKETLYSISKKYNVSVDEIMKQNEKTLAHGLQTGQVIKIKPKK
jgi:LysM repeat protein